MGMWYSQPGPRSRDSGKFQKLKRMGVAASKGGSYRDWSYELIQHQAGSTIKRVRFSVSILDPNGNRAGYLQDFTSLEKAVVAARKWIDEVITQRWWD